MLEIRPNCEHCGKDLPNTSSEAMICSFECTYCVECALDVFKNVCPSCTGDFVKRPIRPAKMIDKYPASTDRIFTPKDLAEINKQTEKLKKILPKKR